VLRLVGGAYVEQEPDTSGFVDSPVWGRAFRLREVADRLGQPDYRLDVR
jgi:hypothetical protein